MNDVVGKLKPPAIGLIAVGILNGVLGLVTLLSGLLRLTGLLDQGGLPASEAERTGYIIGTAFGYGIAFLGLVAAPVIITGGLRMLNGRSYKFARASAILSVIPLISCCFIVGIPVGIWALMVLNQPDVRAFFAGEMKADPPYPPRF